MIRQEAPRNFEEIFGKQTEDPVQLKDNELRESILTAANMLGNNPSESTLVGAIRAFSQQPKTFISKAGGLVYPVIHAGGERAEQLKVIGAILERLDPEYDVETGNIRMGYEPQKHAEDIYDHLSVGRVEEEWKEVQEEISEEDDINLRAQIALKAKQKLMRYFKHNPIKFFDDSRELKPTWKNISRNGTEATIELRHSTLRIESMGDIIEEVNRAIFRGQIENSLDLLPHFDKEKFDELRKTFGAKAANLILLHETLPQINSLLRKSVPAYGQINIPDFVPVPAQLYKKWKSGEDIDKDLEPYFSWASSLVINGQGVYVDEPDSYIVRSSAVNSEDGENLSGAGIYESVNVESRDSGSFDKFKAAVVSVFESTDSPKGRTYREQNGIENEEMGLIIQRHKPDKYTYRDVKNSTVNSSASGQKELIEIKEEDSRFLIKKRVVDQTLMGELPNDAFLLKYDSKHSRGSLSNSKLRSYEAIMI